MIVSKQQVQRYESTYINRRSINLIQWLSIECRLPSEEYCKQKSDGDEYEDDPENPSPAQICSHHARDQ